MGQFVLTEVLALNLILVSRGRAQEVALLLAQPVISVIQQGLAMQRPELARIQ